MALPTPRELLNSIFSTLITTPLSLAGLSNGQTLSSNPLKSLPNSHRALLVTLHAIFPPSMLLQAFDLLDRGLVTRISLNEQDDIGKQQHTNVVQPSITLTNSDSKSGQQSISQNAGNLNSNVRSLRHEVYQVRSSQSTSRTCRRQSHFTSAFTSSVTYMVYLDAWNCSCAAFVFSAFPVPESSSSPWKDFKVHPDKDSVDTRKKNEEWKFGALQYDQDNVETSPICKHLLACLFAEKWESVLGAYVKKRRLGREEMAAVVCQD